MGGDFGCCCFHAPVLGLRIRSFQRGVVQVSEQKPKHKIMREGRVWALAFRIWRCGCINSSSRASDYVYQLMPLIDEILNPPRVQGLWFRVLGA